jgi:oligopeptide/dipeptide ABC transporter ATP-binding protein
VIREPLLEVRDLSVTFATEQGSVRAVNGLDLDVARSERVGIVGESGSGKSVTARAILRLLDNAEIRGRIRFNGIDLVAAPSDILRGVRGAEIGLVLQDPLSALNPVMTIGDQVTETLRIRGVSRAAARRSAVEILGRVGFDQASARLDDYPHQFSGGMRQRVLIAAATIAEPQLLIADEPTTALDVRTQAQVLDLLQELAEERKMAMLLISHDMAVVAGFTQRVLVMYAGKCVEESTTDHLFYSATHPYTWGLLGSVPAMDREPPLRLPTISGQPPSPIALPPGCSFHPRCTYAQRICREEVPALVVRRGAEFPSACHFAGSIPRPPYLPARPVSPR